MHIKKKKIILFFCVESLLYCSMCCLKLEKQKVKESTVPISLIIEIW